MHTYRLLDLTPKGRDEDGLRLHHGMGAPPRPLRAGAGRRKCCADDMLRPMASDEAAAQAGRLGAADCLSLAAAPTFAVMALLTAVLGGGPLDMLCGAASPLSGMVPMYLLMSAFHTAPWLKLISMPSARYGKKDPSARPEPSSASPPRPPAFTRTPPSPASGREGPRRAMGDNVRTTK